MINIMTLYFKMDGGPWVDVFYQIDLWKDVL